MLLFGLAYNDIYANDTQCQYQKYFLFKYIISKFMYFLKKNMIIPINYL